MKESNVDSNTGPIHIEFESFISPLTKSNSSAISRAQQLSIHSHDQLIVYSAPVIQSQLQERCRQINERLKEVKKEKTSVASIIAKSVLIKQGKHHEDQQQ